MMKKILFFTFVGLLMALTSSGQTASDTLQQANDSVTIGSHTEFSAAAQENSVTKAEGDSAYVKNDYASAIQIYEALLKEGEAAEVYYNLGNSYYKAGDIAKAILNYERALLIQPGNADIRANLEIARAKTIDKVIPVPEVFFVSWTKSLINCLSVDAWAKVGVVCFFLLLASLYFFFFSKQIVWKKAAKSDELVSRDSQQMQTTELWLDYQTAGPGLSPEQRYSRLCAWVQEAAARDLRYGLRLPQREISPNTGHTHALACLEALALA